MQEKNQEKLRLQKTGQKEKMYKKNINKDMVLNLEK